MASDVAFSRSLIGVGLAVSLCLPAWPTSAQTAPALATGVQPVQGPAVVRERATTVQGGAWYADNTPIPLARLRLRSVVTGTIEATTQANAGGEFNFSGIPGGTYLVELVNDGGRVLAVGQTFTIAQGETVATVVRLGSKVRWYYGFFGNAALAAATSAALAGIVALLPEAVTSVSPNR